VKVSLNLIEFQRNKKKVEEIKENYKTNFGPEEPDGPTKEYILQ